ncbi:MAG: DUF86 domain-containing protein [Anaerolineae bacterium]|nr:DUF86 domain-containing protein [Anaerolineae bacterium]
MPRDAAYVLDILDAARRIQAYVTGIDKATFETDGMRQDAIIRRIEIIGEATKRLSMEYRARHPEIAWQQMAGMRDVLIHSYDAVDVERVWNTAAIAIPDLIAKLEPLAQAGDENGKGES